MNFTQPFYAQIMQIAYDLISDRKVSQDLGNDAIIYFVKHTERFVDLMLLIPDTEPLCIRMYLNSYNVKFSSPVLPVHFDVINKYSGLYQYVTLSIIAAEYKAIAERMPKPSNSSALPVEVARVWDRLSNFTVTHKIRKGLKYV